MIPAKLKSTSVNKRSVKSLKKRQDSALFGLKNFLIVFEYGTRSNFELFLDIAHPFLNEVDFSRIVIKLGLLLH